MLFLNQIGMHKKSSFVPTRTPWIRSNLSRAPQDHNIFNQHQDPHCSACSDAAASWDPLGPLQPTRGPQMLIDCGSKLWTGMDTSYLFMHSSRGLLKAQVWINKRLTVGVCFFLSVPVCGPPTSGTRENAEKPYKHPEGHTAARKVWKRSTSAWPMGLIHQAAIWVLNTSWLEELNAWR